MHMVAPSVVKAWLPTALQVAICEPEIELEGLKGQAFVYLSLVSNRICR